VPLGFACQILENCPLAPELPPFPATPNPPILLVIEEIHDINELAA
jgi:hypothetical protein